jgi:CheY-like chemotaxis protein
VARVLVCEPHPDVASLLAFVVRRLGHDPVAFGDGGDDVDALIVEPGDAATLAVAARARRRSRALPILCVSIFPPFEDAERLEPDAYLVKPFQLHELEEALETALRPAAVAL